MRFYTQQHQFYCGIDLHARTMYLCILNRDGEILVHRNMCALSDILATSPDNLAKNRVKMAIESRRRHFYAFEFYKIWHLYI